MPNLLTFTLPTTPFRPAAAGSRKICLAIQLPRSTFSVMKGAKRIEDKLFKDQSLTVRALNKQSRKELRLIARAKWKNEHPNVSTAGE